MANNPNLHPLHDAAELLRQRRFRLATRRGYLDLAKNMAVMVLLAFVALTQVFYITIARGTDMYPAILDGDILLCYRMEQKYLKNDVVVCSVEGREVVGRVVAREGDSVNITEEGVLSVNGTVQTGEIAFPTNPGNQTYPYTVPQGTLYLLGDFRPKTTDSRDFGPVPLDAVKAKVVSVFRRRGI